MKTKTNILVICNSCYISGAEISLVQLINEVDRNKYEIILLLPINSKLSVYFPQFKIIYLPFIWFQKTVNPIRLIQYLLNVIILSWKIRNIARLNSTKIIYSNSIKAYVYGAIVKLFSGRKNIWHIRDNLKRGIVSQIMIMLADKIICISKSIYNQVNASKNKKELIFGGIDLDKWNSPVIQKKFIKNELLLPAETKLIAIISQLTPWKNHIDFIKASRLIIDKCEKVHFLIVGDILNQKDQKYKKQIQDKISELEITNYITFLGYRQDVKEIVSQIDILLHTAINEPFGRVLIEAMAMEKPIVAYNCGGSKEIILQNETGYLVDPYNYKGLAKKALILIENEELRLKLGQKGRKRVMESFNIDSYVHNLEKVFDSI